MSEQSTQVPAFRRNGKRPSCEPCRKAKYRCDHRRPVCEKCQARNIASKCIYHPAPMTGSRLVQNNRLSASENPLRSGSTTTIASVAAHDRRPLLATGEPAVSEGYLSTPTDTGHLPQIIQTLTPGQSSSSVDAHVPADDQSRTMPADDSFLGSTAFNAPFADNQGELPSTDDESDTSPEFGHKLHEQITAKQIGNYQLESRMKEAMNIMKFLKQFPALRNIVGDRSHFTPECGIMSEWIVPAIDSIDRDIYSNGTLDSEVGMIEMIRRLFKATTRPIKLGPTSRYGDLMPQFCGQNIRWESVALLLLVTGLCVCSMSCDSRLLSFNGNTESARQDLMYRLYETSNTCISFCDELGCTNEVYIAILVESGVYTSQVLGDTHHIVWRKLGDIATAVFARGWHLPERSKHLPFWLRETRIRCFGIAYALDKVVSCFLGRPPRIAKRYCQVEVPLDLEWSELAQDEEALQASINALTEKGWHEKTLRGEAREWLWLRPFVLNSLLREEVLEICLGPPQQNFRETALDLMRRNHETHKSLPHYLDRPPGQWVDQPPGPLERQLFTDFRYNEFLVRRTMVRHLGEGLDELLELAHSILLSVIETYNIRKRTSASNFEVQWSSAFYGLPTAASLALELLQQKSKTLCHSWVAQNLCVFISILRWLHTPGDGNYKLIDRARRTLQSIMDKYLGVLHKNTPFPLSARGQVGDSNLSPPLTDPMLMVGQEAYNFNWLDSEMYEQSFWADFEPYDTMVP